MKLSTALIILFSLTALALGLAYLERGSWEFGMECGVPLFVGAALLKEMEGEDENE